MSTREVMPTDTKESLETPHFAQEQQKAEAEVVSGTDNTDNPIRGKIESHETHGYFDDVSRTASSYLDGYVTPHDFSHKKPSATKDLPYSPFNEDDEYNEFILSDEDLGEFLDQDDDDDDDDVDFDEGIHVISEEDQTEGIHGLETRIYESSTAIYDHGDALTSGLNSFDRTFEGEYEVDKGYMDDDETESGSRARQIDRTLPPLVQSEPPPPSSLPQEENDFAPIGPSTTPTKGTPVLSFRRIRTEASELAASLLWDESNKNLRRGTNRDRNKPLVDKSILLKYLRGWGGNSKNHHDSSFSIKGIDQLSGNLSDLPVSRSADEILGEERDNSSDSLSEASDNQDNISDDSWAVAFNPMERPWEQAVDWSSFPSVPQRFCATSQHSTLSPPFLDASMSHEQMSEKEGNRFVWEQSILLQSVLQLLAERDQVGVEGSIDLGDNVWKKGPLKLLSFSTGGRKRPTTTGWWRIKYVELRQGNLTYYEDSGKGRKTVHLRQADTVVQPSTSHKSQTAFVFELLVQGSPARFWMASSEEEQQAWIRAIQSATIGDEGPKRELDLSTHREALLCFTRIRESANQADSRDAYLEAIQLVMTHDEPLQIPVEWIRQQTKQNEEILNRRVLNISPHRQLKSSIADFWNQMGHTDFSINGATILSQTPYACERVVGALTRCLLEYDKSFLSLSQTTVSGQMTELQAVSYARSILQAVLRSKERQDASSAVHYLLENSDLVSISSPQGDEFVVKLDVSFAGEELPNDLPAVAEEQTGWIKMRRSKQPIKGQKPRFAVLSGSVLSYYEEATPRPHGLRGQMLLNNASIHEKEDAEGEGRHVLLMKTNQHEDCFMVFDKFEEFMLWKTALQNAIDSCTPEKTCANQSDEKNARQAIRRSAERVLKQADGSIRGGIRVIRNATDGSKKLLRGAVGRVGLLRTSKGGGSGQQLHNDNILSINRRPSMHMLLSNTALSGKREPTVQCVVQATHVFDVHERNDTTEGEQWLSVSAKLYQAFLMMGGQNGRIARGDALIEFDFMERASRNDDEEEEAETLVKNFIDTSQEQLVLPH